MTHSYKFEVGYTKLGTASAPSVAPTINVLDMDADTLLVTGGTTTASAVMAGVYKYTYTGTPGLTLRGLFHTTDSSVDQQDLFSVDMNASVTTGTGITVGGGARSGMADIIAELRMLSSAGTADYSLAGADFWSDSQLQDILDRNAWVMDAEPMTAAPAYIDGGYYEYINYYIGRGWLEKSSGGTAIFYVMDYDGSIISSTLYSVDYNIGQVAFTTDQATESIRLVTCTSYDVNASAAEVWRKKASYYHSAVNFSTDGHNISREQMYLHCMEQARYFETISQEASESADLVRSDDILSTTYLSTEE
jgi:hypothetical protein